MKNRVLSFILTLTLLLSALAGCGEETETTTVKTDTPAQSGGMTSAGTNVADESTNTLNKTKPLYPEPDYSDFVMPEETGKLYLYVDGSMGGSIMNPAVERFKQLYPNVEVTYEIVSDDEFEMQVRTEIPAGSGPDVLLGYSSLLPDIYKTMSTGIFTDLAPYMSNDPEYDPADYYEGVMKGGQMYGKQYIIPLSFGINAFMTSKELLEKNGIDSESLKTWKGFYKACTVFHENNPGKALINYGVKDYYISNLFLASGFRMIDYENNNVSFDTERFHEVFDLCRMYCNPEVPENLPIGNEAFELKYEECFLATLGRSTPSVTISLFSLMRSMSQETPVFCPIPNTEGGFTADIVDFASIPEGSQNKLNAWRFIKVLLSDEIQYGDTTGGSTPHSAFTAGNPVRRESLSKQVYDQIDGQPEWAPCSPDDAKQYIEQADLITDAILYPAMTRKYVIEIMTPYITSNDGSNYDKQLAKLISTLELYKDE